MEKSASKSGLIRWGIIGCGDVTEVKSGPAYQKTEGFELKAVMRRDAEKVKDFAQRHGVEKYYTDVDQLIHDKDIDAVYIATPPDTHKLYALKVAEAGKICCIEKPLAPCYKDSLAIYEAFNSKQIPLFVAYYRRSMERFTQVKTWIDHGDIGEVRHISWHLSKAPSAVDISGAYNWRTDAEVAPGGYFDDLASHGLDLFTYLLGDIEDVHGFSLNQQGLYAAKDALTACWKHKNGATGMGVWNFGCYAEEESVEVYGSKGKITFAIFEEGPVKIKSQDKEEELFIDSPENIQLHHVQNMQKDLSQNDYIHPSKGASAVHTSWVMDQIIGIK